MINNNKTSVYNHVEREEILNCILTSLKTDERIAGVLMPEDFLSGLKQTLVISLDANEIMRALRLAVKSFFHEAQNLDDMLGLDVADKLELKMKKYLDLNIYNIDR